MSKLILVSNDDGYFTPGIKILAKTLKKIRGVEVVIVAPDRERSAASHSLTLHRPLRYEKISKDVYAVEGTPTDCVVVASHEILGRDPDLVVSGINRGSNLGDDVHYSGTVSAAMEAAIAGIPGIAVSLETANTSNTYKANYQPAADFAARLAKKVLKEPLPLGTVLNVNVPNLDAKRIKGHVITKLGKRNYGALLVEKLDPKGRKYYWITGDQTGFEDIAGSDCNAVLADQISVTPIQADMTDYKLLKKIKNWRL